jgi:hypothetical protein
MLPRHPGSRFALLLATGWLLLPLAAAGEDAPAASPEVTAPEAASPDAAAKPAAGPGPCHDDVQRLCAAAKGKPRGVVSCLHDHSAELSDACRAQLERAEGRMRRASARFLAACGDDVGRLCGDVAPGEGRRIRCLRQHESELSDACRQAMPVGRGGGAPPS